MNIVYRVFSKSRITRIKKYEHENRHEIFMPNVIDLFRGRKYMYICTLGWLKKTRFWGNQMLFDFVNLNEEKNSREGCGLYDDI